MLSIGTIAAKVFGSSNDRRVKGYKPKVEAINALEPEMERLSDAELRARTDEFRRQVADGVSLDDLIVPAFATVREAAKRSLGQRHFDVQLIGGMVLHQGKIAEMKTGEGKTLVATLAVYLNALTGRGVHVVTVNDYLAKRDAEWMGVIYKFLGLTVGCIVHELDDAARREQYACDVTYGTNNELGFDYLRDNMKYHLAEMVQRGHHYAIGNENMEELLRAADLLQGETLYDIENVTIVHHVNQALKAHKLFQRDRDYIVKAGEGHIITKMTTPPSTQHS